jgi:hypothetical protein
MSADGTSGPAHERGYEIERLYRGIEVLEAPEAIDRP